MRTPTLGNPRPLVVTAVFCAAFAGVFFGGIAVARIMKNTIDATAALGDGGRHLIVTGPIECTAAERAFLRVLVTQRSTGALAEGRGVLTCTGSSQQWEIDAPAQGREAFEEGPATAVAVARTMDHGETTDVHQWLVDITLVAE